MERTTAMRARSAAQMALPVLGAMGAVGAAQIPAAAATTEVAAAPRTAICQTVGPTSLVGKVTGSTGGLVRGILGDYRNPAAATPRAGTVTTSVSRLTDEILGRPETCSPDAPVTPPPPPPGQAR